MRRGFGVVGGVMYPLPWLLFVETTGGARGSVQAVGSAVFGLYLVIGIGELAVAWGRSHGRRIGATMGLLRGLGWGEEARRVAQAQAQAQAQQQPEQSSSGRHRAAEQVERSQRVGKHKAPAGRRPVRTTGQVVGGHRAA